MTKEMRISKHTPGPWHVEDEFIFDDNGLRIADTTACEDEEQDMSDAEADANARLIAAAPRMEAFIQAGYCDDDEAAAILRQIGVEP